MATDYIRRTKQGYTVMRFYLVPTTRYKYDQLFALIYRPSIKDYAIAKYYDVRNGTWGEGSYDYTYPEAIQTLRKYYKAKDVQNPKEISAIVDTDTRSNIFDNFGMYNAYDSDAEKAMFKRAYHIAKQRGMVYIRDLWFNKIATVFADGNAVYVRFDGRYAYRVLADGTIRME